MAAVAATLDLTALLARRPRALSGGQRQRVSIARAVIREPRVLLLDEPLSNLDTALRVRMRHEFARLHQSLGATMIYVTHDQLEAMTLANRIVVMANGRVEQVHPPMDLYHRPASLAVARAIGSPKMNLMPVTIVASNDTGTRVRLSDGAEIEVAARAKGEEATVTLGIRLEHLHPADDGPFAGPVELFERLGPLSLPISEHTAPMRRSWRNCPAIVRSRWASACPSRPIPPMPDCSALTDARSSAFDAAAEQARRPRRAACICAGPRARSAATESRFTIPGT